jgi:Flp pilus assembly protein TadB
MYVRYNLYFWTPPILTPEQEIQVGRQIVLEGRETFLKRAPYLSDEDRRHVEAGKHYTPKQRIILCFIGVVFLIVLIVTAWPLLFGIIPIVLYSGGTLWHSRARYHRWVDEMIAKYAASAAQQLKEPTYAKIRP